MQHIDGMALFLLSEEGKAKKDSIYSVVCNPRHAVKPFLRDSDLDNLVFSNPDFVLELTEVQKGLALFRTVPFDFTEGRFKQMVQQGGQAPAIPSHPIPQPQRDAGKKGRPLRAQDHAIYASSTPAKPDRHGLQFQQDVGKKAASPRTQDQTTNASDSLIRPDRTVIEKYIQGMAFTETGKQKLSQLYDSAASPNQPVHPFLGDEDILTLALRDTAASEPAIRKGLHVLQTIPSVLKDGRLKQMVLQLPSAQPGPIKFGQTLVGGSTRAGILSSDQQHLNAKAGADQTIRPNGREKAGCAPGPDLTKSQQSEVHAGSHNLSDWQKAIIGKDATADFVSRDESRLKPHEPSLPNAHSKQQRKGRQGKKQPDAAGSKQNPTSKAQRQSQRLKEKPEPPKRQKQNNNRTRVADESQNDGLGMLVAATELDDEAEISSTTSSDADGDEEPQELYDSGSGRD
ncbi:TPA: hypothetical protein ACH3X1_003977 [Trebouxia sp. C0004]